MSKILPHPDLFLTSVKKVFNVDNIGDSKRKELYKFLEEIRSKVDLERILSKVLTISELVVTTDVKHQSSYSNNSDITYDKLPKTVTALLEHKYRVGNIISDILDIFSTSEKVPSPVYFNGIMFHQYNTCILHLTNTSEETTGQTININLDSYISNFDDDVCRQVISAVKNLDDKDSDLFYYVAKFATAGVVFTGVIGLAITLHYLTK